jgi:hypothetical protein
MAETGKCLVLLARVAIKEVAREHHDIGRALAQRGQVDGQDVESIEQVFAELALTDHLQRIAIGGADDADIDLAQMAIADARQRAGLEEAEELGLQREIHFPDFIEEEGAAIGEFGCALAIFMGAGKGAAGNPEQFAFHQVARNGGAVDGNEALALARTLSMQRLGADILAGPALAGDENGCRRGGDAADLLVDELHGVRAADKAGIIGNAFAATGIDAERAGTTMALGQFANARGQRRSGNRLGDIVMGAGAHGAHRRADRSAAGHGNHEGTFGKADEAGHALIVALGNVGKARHIGKDDVETGTAQHLECFAAGRDKLDNRRAEQGAAQRFAHSGCCLCIAVDQQEPSAQRVVEARIHCHCDHIPEFARPDSNAIRLWRREDFAANTVNIPLFRLKIASQRFLQD